MTNKKNKFLTFCFSVLPGAGEMYLGFYKMGLSLMSLFTIIITLTGALNIPVLSFLIPVIWFYSFFHVHNLNALSDEEFYGVEDNWLFFQDIHDVKLHEFFIRHKRSIAFIMIFLGANLIWNIFQGILFRILELFHIHNEIYHIIRSISYSIPQCLIGIVIIYVGIQLIKGKKDDLDSDVDPVIPAPPYVAFKEVHDAAEAKKPEDPAN